MQIRASVRAASLWLALAPAAAMADAPSVATDIAPIHSLAAKVMEGVGTPELILPPGASPHGYSLRPSEAAALDRADVVFVQGGGLTPWLDGAIETLAADARVVELIEVPGTTRLEYREGAVFAQLEDDHDHDHEDEHGHEEAHDHDDHDHDDGHDDHAHDHSGLDPHAWLDPENARVWVRAMAEVLAEADPANADLYRANAERAQDEIGAAAIRVAHFIAPLREQRFVVFHDAYQYFENRFGLHAFGSIAEGDASDPGPGRLAELRDALADSGVTCVLAEPQFDPGLIEAVTAGGTNSGVIDPMGADIPPGPDFYIQLINHVAGAIGECL
ncbi:zinc ABC transporter substrate-binding protein [Roseovarius amoyensis]|uniref:zinc ABC transporter substrate-binding protein n=1 Tax=Roseovarius amoyensis TaxID=2211448 RepID=UPI000DBE7494|nr:zinc ABC transporter substrate-binding protein [Roseovarius amoyensis]